MADYNTYQDSRCAIRCTECNRTAELCMCEYPGMLAEVRLTSPESMTLAVVRERIQLLQDEEPIPRGISEGMVEAMGELFNKKRHHEHSFERGVPAAEVYQAGIRLLAVVTRFLVEGEQGGRYNPDEIFGSDRD
jgi:hypothetical protein